MYHFRDFSKGLVRGYMLGDGTSPTGRQSMAVEVAATRRRFTRAEYYRMAEVGILGRRDRVELISGEIIEMSPIGRRHQAFVDNLGALLVLRLADRAIVRVQGPVALADDTEPEPDLTVLRRRPVPYKEREAWAEDALLIIEVADTSLAYDRSTKLRLYAEAGIPEYWVVDSAAETVDVYREPGAEGYRDVTRVAGRATLTLQTFPDVELTTTEIFA
ncbi:MAG: Uma2 family endonuclease [Candidatus Rokuibacteriota bacterium]|nr:MAG: Uma2 family endonuclease [Candidatus Rokubacteria bacterium]